MNSLDHNDVRELLDILDRCGPTDSDDWCEHGSGCSMEDDYPPCKNCEDFHRYQELVVKIGKGL